MRPRARRISRCAEGGGDATQEIRCTDVDAPSDCNSTSDPYEAAGCSLHTYELVVDVEPGGCDAIKSKLASCWLEHGSKLVCPDPWAGQTMGSAGSGTRLMREKQLVGPAAEGGA